MNELLLQLLFGILDVLQRMDYGYTEGLDSTIRDLIKTYRKLEKEIEGDNNE
jgi:hypothetical protein